MKLFIKNSIYFLLVSGLFYVVALFFLELYGPRKFKKNINYRIGSYGNMFTRMREVPKFENVDILFLGSSHAYRGFDVRVFKDYGFSSFNLGSSAQTPIQTKLLLKRYLQKLNPKVVVYEVYPGTFCSDGVESAVDIIANDRNDWESAWMTIKLGNIKVLNTFLYASTRDVFNLNSEFSEPLIREKDYDTYIPGGYVEKKIFHYKPKIQQIKHWDFNPKQFKEFASIMDDLKMKGIKPYLVYAPITQGLYNSYNNNQYFDSVMNSYGNYYNFNFLFPLTDSVYFYDEHHLNQDGVELFNEELVNVITSDRLISISQSDCYNDITLKIRQKPSKPQSLDNKILELTR